jgi:ABC-type bacteriocin/lantibiotic exporter with double-glycine peptidase domain
MKHITAILGKHRWKIAIIYVYIIIGQVLFLLEPYFLGKAIDGLLVKDYTYLFALFGAHVGENIFMYKRMVYDIRVYTRIYNEIVADYLERDKSDDTSAKVARTEMLHVVIDFIEHHLHFYVSSILTIIGSLYFVFIQHAPTGWIMICCLPLIAIIVKVFYGKISQAMRVGNSHYEQKFGIMDSKDDIKIGTFYERRRRVIIAQSTVLAKHWFSLNVTKTVFLVIAIALFTSNSVGLSHGTAISIYTYINNFLISLMSLPIFIEVFTRIKDVIKRISLEDE